MQSPPQSKGVRDMEPRQIGMYYNILTGITTIQFGSLKVEDAAHAARSLAMMYEAYNKNPDNAHRQYPQEIIDGFWEFAASLQQETEALSNGK